MEKLNEEIGVRCDNLIQIEWDTKVRDYRLERRRLN